MTTASTHQLTLDDFVPGHQHDESCEVTKAHYHNEWCALAEALWQVASPRDLFEIGSVSVALEQMARGWRTPDPALARDWLAMAEAKERDEIADVPNGPETLAAVAAALERMTAR